MRGAGGVSASSAGLLVSARPTAAHQSFNRDEPWFLALAVPGVVVTSIAELYTLQELDLALDADRASLVDAESRLGESEEVVEARLAMAERQDALRSAEREFKEREWDADEVRRKIEPLERRLYEGSVRNPKELEDLQQDVESLKRRRSELEDRALGAMEALEQAQQAMTEAQRRLEDLTGSYETEQEELRGRLVSLKEEIGVLEGRRIEQAARINGSLLRLYEQLRATRQGRAVAKVEGGSCRGCRISLPVNLIQRARSGNDIVQCSSCERILYVS